MDVLTACHQALAADLWGAVMSAFTAEHVERARIANAAAEVTTGLTCYPVLVRGNEALNWSGPESEEVERRASLLSKMAVHGPDYVHVCPAHDQRPDTWAQCGKVSVASALLGRTCWKAQP